MELINQNVMPLIYLLLALQVADPQPADAPAP